MSSGVLVSKLLTLGVLANPAKGLDVSKAATYAVVSRPGSGAGQSAAKIVAYAVLSTEDVTKVSKAIIYSVVEVPRPVPEKVSKVLAYAVAATPVGEREMVSKAASYAVTGTYGLRASKAVVKAVVTPIIGNYISKLTCYAAAVPRAGADISKALAYAVIERPLPILQQKKIPQAIDFASITWDQQNRLLQYEVVRRDGLDQPGPAWQPPRTITLRCWQVVPFTPTEDSVRVSKTSGCAVTSSRALSVSKSATYVLVAPRSLWVPKVVCYSVLSTYLPGISLSKCIAEVVCVPVDGAFVVKAVAYAVVY